MQPVRLRIERPLLHLAKKKNTQITIREILDKEAVYIKWRELFLDAYIENLYAGGLDRIPIILQTTPFKTPKNKAFWFEWMWTTHPGCKELIEDKWKNNFNAPRQSTVHEKLRYLTPALQEWNRQNFGHLHQQILTLKRKMAAFYDKPSYRCQEADFDEIKSQLNDLLKQEEIFWAQKSRVSWLKWAIKIQIFFIYQLSREGKGTSFMW